RDLIRDGQPGCARGGVPGLVLLATAVPFLVVFLAEHPRPTRRQGSGGGPPPQDLRIPGQPRPGGTLSLQVHFRRAATAGVSARRSGGWGAATGLACGA